MRYVVGISGATGMVLANRLVGALEGHEIDLVITRNALYAASYELGEDYSSAAKWHKQLKGNITLHPNADIGSSIASGSHKTDGMIIIPCSMATVAAISCGLGDNCLRRAADVTIKEKRPLILVPREVPLSTLHLENLLRLSKLGATIVPPMPAWYTQPKTLEDIENFIVGKVLDTLGLEHDLYPRWKN